MSLKNTPAAKAVRREAKVVRTAAPMVTNYSSLKNVNMGQTNNSGYATKQPKDIKIGISYFMTFVKSVSTVDYTTDLERFTNTYNHVKNHPAGVLVFRSKMYEILMDLIKTNAPIDEYFYTIGMHYLVTFDSVKMMLENQPNTALGFMIEPVQNDVDGAMVFGVDYNTWEYTILTRSAA
jgi:hypothetical protein